MIANAFANPLPGVPDVESPFFDELFAEKSPPPETMRVARDLRDKGYAVFDLPDPDFDARAERVRGALSLGLDFDRWRRELHPVGLGLRVQDAWRTNDDVRTIAANPGVLKLLSDLYGRRAFPFQTLNFPVGTQQETHNDSVHFSCVPERFMCGVWVALEDVDASNGPLRYYPGSHRFPNFVNEHLGVCAADAADPAAHYRNFVGLWSALVEKAGLQLETFCAKRGQALIWASHLLHGGAPHEDTSRTRWSQVTHYFFEDCVYYTPLLSDPAYGQTYYRSLVDVGTGEPALNRYAGRPVPPAVIERALPGFAGRDGFAGLPTDFSGDRYLALNPDVARSGIAPDKHYIVHGMREGRRWR